jgi:hypothetical protein
MRRLRANPLPITLLVLGVSVPAGAQTVTGPTQSAPAHKHYEETADARRPGPDGRLAPRLQALGAHTFPVSGASPRA